MKEKQKVCQLNNCHLEIRRYKQTSTAHRFNRNLNWST